MPSSLTSLGPHHSTLSVLLNHDGGIIDDTVVTKHTDDAFYVVTNAGRRERDLAWFKEHLDIWNKEKGGVLWEVLDTHGLLALQGPKAAEVLQKLTDYPLKDLTFGKSAFLAINNLEEVVHVARGGYTGEDGFEVIISLPVISIFRHLTFPPDLCAGESHDCSCRASARFFGGRLTGASLWIGSPRLASPRSWHVPLRPRSR